MTHTSGFKNRRGIALFVVIMVILAVAAITLAASTISLNTSLIQRQRERSVVLENAALAGLEEARSRLNGTASLYPDSGFVVLDDSVNTHDATGGSIPNVRRWVYAGPTGIRSGQYGIQGSIVAVTADADKVAVIIRRELDDPRNPGQTYTTIWVDMWRFVDGKADEHWDTATINAAAGRGRGGN